MQCVPRFSKRLVSVIASSFDHKHGYQPKWLKLHHLRDYSKHFHQILWVCFRTAQLPKESGSLWVTSGSQRVPVPSEQERPRTEALSSHPQSRACKRPQKAPFNPTRIGIKNKLRGFLITTLRPSEPKRKGLLLTPNSEKIEKGKELLPIHM